MAILEVAPILRDVALDLAFKAWMLRDGLVERGFLNFMDCRGYCTSEGGVLLWRGPSFDCPKERFKFTTGAKACANNVSGKVEIHSSETFTLEAFSEALTEIKLVVVYAGLGLKALQQHIIFINASLLCAAGAGGLHALA